MSRADRVAGGLWGLLIADAVGVPYEFHRADALPPIASLDMIPPPGFRRAHPGTPPGTWSDDGAQALALLDSLLTMGRLDLDDFGARLLAWFDQGAYTPDGRVFDCGMQTQTALDALRRGVPAATSGRTDEQANGNGALMRVLPMALWHAGDDAALIADAERSGLPTHGHLRSGVVCALVCLWARRRLEGEADGFDAACAGLRAAYAGDRARAAELEVVLSTGGPTGSGYVVDTLHGARHALTVGGDDYAAVVRAAIALGRDTDTTACVAGGLAGLRAGVAGIPAAWRSALRGAEQVDRLLGRLLG
jgi:ADP-ribosyl-[dinitrogen reductase] hydrolase